MWRLQNDQAPGVARGSRRRKSPTTATFTEITIDVRPKTPRSASLGACSDLAAPL
jgi:hypothetical protein